MLVGDAITACGLTIEQPDGDVIVVAVNQHGTLVHRTAGEVAGNTLGRNFYQAGGVFRPGAIVNNKGRVAENLVRIVWLAFDADLSDYLGWEKADLWSLDDQTLIELIDLQRADLERIVNELGLSFTRLDYTGYGLCGYLYLDDVSGKRIDEVRTAYKGLVSAINQRWGQGDLVDRSVSDAGTRITRIPGSINDKGKTDRVSKTLSQSGEVFSLEQLQSAAGQRPSNVIHLNPTTTLRLPQEVATQLVDQMVPVWTQGQKHIVSLGLSGMLAKAGVAQEQALDIVRAISERAGDERPDDREKTVLSTYKRLSAGEQTAGYFSLKGRIPDALLAWIDQELGRLRQATVTVIMPGISGKANDDQSRAIDFLPPPEIAVRGWVSEYIDAVTPTTEAVPAFHLGCAVTVAGSLMGRRIAVECGEVVYPNLFTLLVGASGASRKDTAIRRSLRLISDSHFLAGQVNTSEVTIATDVASSEGVVRQLSEKPNTLLYLTEFSKVVNNSRREGTKTITNTLMQAWDTPVVMQNMTKAAPIEARFPYLSILGATQPEILADLMTDTDIHSGFANRFLFVCGGVGPANPWPPALPKSESTRLYLDIMDAVKYYGETTLGRTAAATAFWEDWYRAFHGATDRDAEESAMVTRHPAMALKLALIYAVLDRAPAIDREHLETGVAIVEWSWANIKPMLPSWGGSIDNKIQAKIIETLTKRGSMTRRDLQRYAKGRRPLTDYHKVFEIMLKTGEFALDPTGKVGLADG